MTETTLPPSDDRSPDPVPVLSPSERFFARMALAQTVTAFVAVLISCAAMYATWEQARAARIQTEAQVWPRIVSYVNMNSGAAGTERFEAVVANHGVGPAEIRAMRVMLDGEAITTFQEIFDRMGEASGTERSYSYVAGRIFAPGEAAAVISVQGAEDVARLLRVIGSMQPELCYCSILNQCWLAREELYESVAQCPDYGAEQFRNQP
ncbi:MAG: hypothetical protein JJU26_11755 [Oceanicaulis sp.]|uniref:hypothetical protein n=1 Tax=Glycocaulis sp. TaxID=1969725 RepID=UPI0025B9368E|nr:hypothetical protein [Glycocaulis sp.]MCC5982380.1 hypothetical protein [Oceanicaulis sp.]MCH8521778.1 hypothetical protein [Glycocaulis sp.]